MDESPDAARAAWRDLRRLVAGPEYPPPARQAGARRWWQPYAAPVAVLVVVGLAAAGGQFLLAEFGLHLLLASLLSFAGALPVLLALARPLLAWRLAYLALWWGAATVNGEPWPWNPVQILAYLLVLGAVAARASAGTAAWAGLFTLLPVFANVQPSNAAAVPLLIAGVVVTGDQIRRRRRSQQALAVQAEVSEREQARRAVLEERARIARELHDVVAHHMSLLAVRAETAPYRLTAVDEAARAEFVALAGAARDALADLRRLLGVLRSEGQAPELAPQPDLAAVGDLVAAARRAGMDVRYLPPEPADLERPPAPVALAGYRIVQEAVANATRHAPGAVVTVQVFPGAAELALRVHNGPAPGGDARPDDARPDDGRTGDGRTGDGDDGDAPADGHGVAGMRERAVLLGGEFSAGPTAQGGFSVAAMLPYGDDGGAGGDRRPGAAAGAEAGTP
ncbi:MAG TPA: histidine kinase [Pilimelia sp.]|nr:histidine kinase [Pilimelia sp.]